MSRLTLAAGALSAAAVVAVPLGIAAASPESSTTASRHADTTNTLLQEKASRNASLAKDRYAELEVVHIRFVKRQDDIRVFKAAMARNHLLDIAKLQQAVAAQQAEALLKAQAAAQTRAAAASAPTAPRSTSTYTAPATGGGRCGGSLPPCYVMHRESGGSLTARNPSSTASGKWQFLDSTWNGYGGYAHASDAPESVQDAKAASVWSGGGGCSAWSAC